MAAALLLTGSFLVTVPAAAEDSGGVGPGNDLLSDTWHKQPTTGEGINPGADGEEPPSTGEGGGAGDDEQPSYNDGIEGLQSEGPIGPVGSTGVPTYGALWAPGEMIPTAVEILFDDANVELFTLEPEDRSLFAALLVIDNHEAPTEYRFENAVPEGHTAELQPDGSVRFFDADGNESGGIASPWAIDANGEEVPTRYTLDGTTLIQAIDHEGAAYPVVADPVWLVAVVALAIRVAPTASAVVSACGPAQCVAVATTTGRAVYNHVRPRGGSSGGGRPGNTPTCNARNRTGC
ncbi:hypothetical protein [Candidatus Poriferisodalis sp.]|uniref:hypothetical protein n=1 Tax=Candidatus Poriferisodalis sp. TaxID=3101277 RepID=UPI003AF54CEC